MRGIVFALALLLVLPAAAQAGTVETGPAINVTAARGTLTGSLTGTWTCDPNKAGDAVFGYVDFDVADEPGKLAASGSGYGGGMCSADGRSFESAVSLEDEWPGSTFYFRAYWDRADAHGVGAVRSFRVPEGPPTVDTPSVSEVDYESVTFRARIQDGGRLTTWRVLYGPESEGLTYKTATQQLPGEGGAPKEVAAFAEELEPCTRYRYVVEATNSLGTDDTESTFTTLGCPPAPTNPEPGGTTYSAADTTATLGGAVSSELEWTWWMEYGPVGGALLRTPEVGPMPPTSGPWFFEANVTGLTPGTAYRYQVVARNSRGEMGYSGFFTFRTTGTAPAAPAAAGSGGGSTAPPLVPVSPGGQVVTPSPTVPLRATLDSSGAPRDTLARAFANALTGLRRGAVRVRDVPVPAPGRVSVVVRQGKAIVARGAATATRAGRRAVVVRPTRALRRGAKLTVTATFTPRRGRPTTGTARLTLR